MPTMKALRILMVVATLFLLVGILSTTALAQTYPPTTPPTTGATTNPQVEGAVVEQGENQGGAVQGGAVQGASAAPLAFTGAELTLLLGGLGILLAGGAVALIAGRRRASRAG